MCWRVWRPCCRGVLLLGLVGRLERAQVGVHRHLRVHHDVPLGGQVHDQVGAQPAAVGAVTLTWETKSTCSVMFAAATQLRSCISPHAPRTCGRLSADTSVPVWSRRRPTSALIDSNICRVCPCVVRRSCSSLATCSLTRRRFCAIGSRLRLISSVRFPSSPAAVARSASRRAFASFSTCSEIWRSVSEEIAFICLANCSRLPRPARSCPPSRPAGRRAATDGGFTLDGKPVGIRHRRRAAFSASVATEPLPSRCESRDGQNRERPSADQESERNGAVMCLSCSLSSLRGEATSSDNISPRSANSSSC